MKVERPLYFEDFEVDQVYETGEHTLEAEEIIAFGKNYAPLPYHTDIEAAKDTSFGTLVAPLGPASIFSTLAARQ